MNILAIDTSTEACSAALCINGESITARYQLAPREHSRLILKMIDDLMAQAELSVTALHAIAFGRGPGSFMGLRIAAGVVQGIAFAHDTPVIPVSTLKAIAQRCYIETGNQYVLATIDARMDEVYWAAYYLDNHECLLQGEECVISPDKVLLPDMPVQSISSRVVSSRAASEATTSDTLWVGAGTGWSSYQQRLLLATNCQLPAIYADCLPSAEIIAQLAMAELKAGNTLPAAQAIPIYLRNDVAKKPKPVRL